MSISLLDVNVLIALLDADHRLHRDAHEWFVRNRRFGWATCPVTVNGCIRVMSNPAYPVVGATPAGVLRSLKDACATADHHWWNDDVSLFDNNLFVPEMIRGPKQITDVYLLGLAVRHRGKLVTFDASIPNSAVLGSRNALELIPGVN